MIKGLIIILLLSSASVLAADNKAVMTEYFERYANRSDYSAFINSYHKDAELVDMIYGHHAKGRKQIDQFLNWPVNQITVVNNKPILSVNKQSFSGEQVITQGIFHQFVFNGTTLGPWRFIMIHTLNEDGKIVYQEDWINYTPKKDFTQGKNLNHLTLKK